MSPHLRETRQEQPAGNNFLRWAALVAVPLLAACSGGGDAKTAAASRAMAPPPATAVPAPTAPPPATSPADDRQGGSSTLIILDEPEEESAPTSLVEAARRSREERRQRTDAPRVTITDENLKDYATGQVTLAQPASSDDAAETSEDVESVVADEQFWRQGARRLRLELRQAVDEAAELDRQVAGLRLRFYAEDDPFVRDGQVKPAWDEALERQRQVQQEILALRDELEGFLERGRQAGALPGWLREGIELEPEFEDDLEGAEEEDADRLPRHRPVSPDAIDEDPKDP